MANPKLIIELEANGQVTVNGPIQNKLLCYGLLEAAKDAIKEFKIDEKNQIIVPNFEIGGKQIPGNGGQHG